MEIDLHLSDAVIDLVGGGFDIALRIAALPDSTLRGRRLCTVRRPLVAAPAYLAQYGRPLHPRELKGHSALICTGAASTALWRFSHALQGDFAARVKGRLRANNADAFEPALLAGLGIAIQPEFVVWRDLVVNRLEEVLPDWSMPTIGVNLVTPPSHLRPARVAVLLSYLESHFASVP